MPHLDDQTKAFARGYASRGWPVFPLLPGQKRPHPSLAPNGLKCATTSPRQVEEWWTACPDAGVAIRCGGLLVVDIDGEEASRAFEDHQRRHGALPETLWGQTPRGGWHAYFTQDGSYGNTAGRLALDIDTRGTGGYVVAPPSCTERGRYEWYSESADVAPAPRWLLRLLRPPEPQRTSPQVLAKGGKDAYTAAALRAEVRAVAEAVEGTRNHQLNASAYSLGQLIGAGLLDSAEVFEALVSASRACGLSEREGRRTIQSGLTAGIAQPRRVAS